MENKVDNMANESKSQEACATALESDASTSKQGSSKKPNRFSRRNLIRGGIAAAIVGAGGAIGLPSLGQADEASNTATKQDIASLEQELSLLTKAASDAEVVSHKVYTIDSTATDNQYPSAKAVYDALTAKVNVNQGEENYNKIFVVNEYGQLKLRAFTATALSPDDDLPVQNKVIYAAVKSLNDALSDLDEVPRQHEGTVGDPTEVGVKSHGVFTAYQTTYEIDNFAKYKNAYGEADVTSGINYKYTGDAITGTSDTFSVKKIDKTFIAISQSDPSAVYVSNDAGSTWALPYGGW